MELLKSNSPATEKLELEDVPFKSVFLTVYFIKFPNVNMVKIQTVEGNTNHTRLSSVLYIHDENQFL